MVNKPAKNLQVPTKDRSNQAPLKKFQIAKEGLQAQGYPKLVLLFIGLAQNSAVWITKCRIALLLFLNHTQCVQLYAFCSRYCICCRQVLRSVCNLWWRFVRLELKPDFTEAKGWQQMRVMLPLLKTPVYQSYYRLASPNSQQVTRLSCRYLGVFKHTDHPAWAGPPCRFSTAVAEHHGGCAGGADGEWSHCQPGSPSGSSHQWCSPSYTQMVDLSETIRQPQTFQTNT